MRAPLERLKSRSHAREHKEVSHLSSLLRAPVNLESADDAGMALILVRESLDGFYEE